ncbi:MAG: GNAT family N-acetyltransferase [Myxococcales bacterium]|nr:GNAT family N-acetyltransferase [Myxococcales bacterium]
MRTRGITQADFHQIVSVIDYWWGGPTSALAHPMFFHEYGHHALIVEESERMVGFLLGFVTDRAPRVGYIHLVGIDPEVRRRGVGRRLYEQFARQARVEGAVALKAITTPGNQGSLDFHKANGYTVDFVEDYAGPGRARYVFTRAIDAAALVDPAGG